MFSNHPRIKNLIKSFYQENPQKQIRRKNIHFIVMIKLLLAIEYFLLKQLLIISKCTLFLLKMHLSLYFVLCCVMQTTTLPEMREYTCMYNSHIGNNSDNSAVSKPSAFMMVWWMCFLYPKTNPSADAKHRKTWIGLASFGWSGIIEVWTSWTINTDEILAVAYYTFYETTFTKCYIDRFVYLSS